MDSHMQLLVLAVAPATSALFVCLIMLLDGGFGDVIHIGRSVGLVAASVSAPFVALVILCSQISPSVRGWCSHAQVLHTWGTAPQRLCSALLRTRLSPGDRGALFVVVCCRCARVPGLLQAPWCRSRQQSRRCALLPFPDATAHALQACITSLAVYVRPAPLTHPLPGFLPPWLSVVLPPRLPNPPPSSCPEVSSCRHACSPAVVSSRVIIVSRDRAVGSSSFHLFHAFSDGAVGMIVAACVLGGTVLVISAVSWIASLEHSDAATLVVHLSGRCVMVVVALAATLDPEGSVRLGTLMPTVILCIGHVVLVTGLTTMCCACRRPPLLKLASTSPLLTRGEATVSPLFSALQQSAAGSKEAAGRDGSNNPAHKHQLQHTHPRQQLRAEEPRDRPVAPVAASREGSDSSLDHSTGAPEPKSQDHHRQPLLVGSPGAAPRTAAGSGVAGSSHARPATVEPPALPSNSARPGPTLASPATPAPSGRAGGPSAPLSGAGPGPGPASAAGPRVQTARSASSARDRHGGGRARGDDSEDDDGGGGDGDGDGDGDSAGAGAVVASGGKSAPGAGTGPEQVEAVVTAPAHLESALETARRLARQAAPTSPTAGSPVVAGSSGGAGGGISSKPSMSEKDKIFFQELKRSKEDLERSALESKLAAMSPAELEAYHACVACLCVCVGVGPLCTLGLSPPPHADPVFPCIHHQSCRHSHTPSLFLAPSHPPPPTPTCWQAKESRRGRGIP